MRDKVNYALLGVFVLAMLGATISIGLWLAYGDVNKDWRTYVTYMRESVSGLYVDAPVKYRGVEVGKVNAIALREDDLSQVRVTLDIETYVPVKVDTIAILAVQGVTGIAFIELTGGSMSAPRLEALPGEDYPVLASGPSLFVRLDAAISELIGNLNGFTRDARELLQPELWSSIRDTAVNIERVTSELASHREDLGEGIRHSTELLKHGAEIAAELPQLVRQVSGSARAVESMAQDISQTVAGSGSALREFGGQTLPEVGQLVRELRQLTSTMERLGREVEEEPRMFLYGNSIIEPGPGE